MTVDNTRTDGDDHGSGHEFGDVRGDVRLLRSGGRLQAGRHRGGQRRGLGLHGSGRGCVLFGGDRTGGERRGDGGRGGGRGHGRGGQRQHGGRAGHIGLHRRERTDPTFNETDPTSRAVDENTASGTRAWALPVSATRRRTDDTLDLRRWRERGRQLVRHRHGQRPAAHEPRRWTTRSKSTYAVDGDGRRRATAARTTIDVTVNVTDVDEQPATAGSCRRCRRRRTRPTAWTWLVDQAGPGRRSGDRRLHCCSTGSRGAATRGPGRRPPGTGTMATIDSSGRGHASTRCR